MRSAEQLSEALEAHVALRRAAGQVARHARANVTHLVGRQGEGEGQLSCACHSESRR